MASFGSYAQDQGGRGKVADWRVPIEVNGICVLNGDIVFGDRDSVLIVPREIEVEAFAGALIRPRAKTTYNKRYNVA